MVNCFDGLKQLYTYRTPDKDHKVGSAYGLVTQQGKIIEGIDRPKIWNVYVRRKKVGLGKEIGKSGESSSGGVLMTCSRMIYTNSGRRIDATTKKIEELAVQWKLAQKAFSWKEARNDSRIDFQVLKSQQQKNIIYIQKYQLHVKAENQGSSSTWQPKKWGAANICDLHLDISTLLLVLVMLLSNGSMMSLDPRKIVSHGSVVRETLGEICRLMLEEFTKLHNEQAGDRRESPFSDMDSGAEYRMTTKKVELPSFDGTDPVRWITRAETYFEVQGSIEEVKVRLAKLSMEGATIHWFNLLQEAEVGLSWTKLKRELIGRYGGRTSDNPLEELKYLSQTGSVDEYLVEFEYISSQVYRLPEEQYLGYFIGGLRSEIRRTVHTFNPVNRLQAMHLARDVEAELQGEGFQRGGGAQGWKSNRDWSTGQGEKFGFGSSPHESRSATPQSSVFGDRSSAADRNRGTKHLLYSELMNRKAQGLCFRCGEKYHPLHRCTEWQLRMVVLADDKTGSLNGVTLGVFIDSGASHNFISPHVVAALELKVEKRKIIGVRLGYRHRVSTAGKCEKLDVQLGELSTTVEPYVLELEDIDMILGVSWLRRFGKVTFDWEEMTLSFLWQDKYLELQGQKLKKYEVMSPTGVLQPLPILDRICEDISLDFITSLLKSKGFQAILVVVDWLSKYGHLILLKHSYTTRTIAKLLVKEIELFQLQGKTMKISSPYETDGQTEVVSRCLEAYLQCLVSEQPKNWSYGVPWAEIGEVFYKAVKPTLPIKLTLEEEDKEEPEAVLAARDISKGGNIIKQELVEWKGRIEKETTWEGEVLLKSQFPSFSLEDKVVVAEGSNDRTPDKDHKVGSAYGLVTQQGKIIEGIDRPKIWNVYVRRKKVELGKEIGKKSWENFVIRESRESVGGLRKKKVVSWLGGESSSGGPKGLKHPEALAKEIVVCASENEVVYELVKKISGAVINEAISKDEFHMDLLKTTKK
ncbi:hypothetical protein V8G54_002913 [Vigna mungo]|uniref:Retrotransposon gag domain-containing protein n=1 Tax=Vigna mungo TaxID=3915 RepID=A0AAQ3S9N4_VIGMU